MFISKNRMFILLIVSSIGVSYAQNLLDTSTWTVGSGSVTGFTQNGTSSENSRELGYDHLGNSVVLWKASPDSGGQASGGFTTDYPGVPIDHTKTYRYTIWLKKTNSNDGHSYLGVYNDILSLNGNPNPNPYFWVGDLPQINRWYLVVGYVHKSSYVSDGSTISIGGIYDGVTGERVQTITDFKFSTAATTTRHRSYLYYDSNVNDRQYFYAPRIDQVDGNEPSIQFLMNINPQSKIIFSYDAAGNQTERLYCANCGGDANNKEQLNGEKEAIVENITEEESTLENKISVFPNPTKGKLTFSWDADIIGTISKIEIIGYHTPFKREIVFDNESRVVSVDLSNEIASIYLVQFFLTDGSVITKKIIKQ